MTFLNAAVAHERDPSQAKCTMLNLNGVRNLRGLTGALQSAPTSQALPEADRHGSQLSATGGMGQGQDPREDTMQYYRQQRQRPTGENCSECAVSWNGAQTTIMRVPCAIVASNHNAMLKKCRANSVCSCMHMRASFITQRPILHLARSTVQLAKRQRGRAVQTILAGTDYYDSLLYTHVEYVEQACRACSLLPSVFPHLPSLLLQGGKLGLHVHSDGLIKGGDTFPDLSITIKAQDLHAPLAERLVELPVDITAGEPRCTMKQPASGHICAG